MARNVLELGIDLFIRRGASLLSSGSSEKVSVSFARADWVPWRGVLE